MTLRAPICNSEKALPYRDGSGLLPIFLLQGWLYANKLYLMGLGWSMWQRFGVDFSSCPATAFIDLEIQKPSQVIEYQDWSCSTTSTLSSLRYHGETRHVTWTLRMGKRHFGRARGQKQWVYTPANTKELRHMKISYQLQETQNWYYEGERGEVLANESEEEKEVQGHLGCWMGSTHWGLYFKINAEMEAF